MFYFIDNGNLQSGDIQVRFDVLEGGTLEITARLSPRGLEILERYGAPHGASGYEVFGQFLKDSVMERVREALEDYRL